MSEDKAHELCKSKGSLQYYKLALKAKEKIIVDMDKKIIHLNGLIERIQNNNEDYKKIERLAEEKVNGILTHKKAIILSAVITVIGALRSDPDKQLLIYDAVETPSMNAIISSSQNPESYVLLLHPHHKRF